MFCTAKFGNELINSNPDWFRYDLVWNKIHGVSFLSANKMPMRSHELIYVFSKKGANYNRIDIEGDFKGTQEGTGNVGGSVYGCADSTRTKPIHRNGTREGIRCVKSVIEISNKKGKGKHPTEKPQDLYEWLITRYSKEGDTILDPTAGSFSSCFTAQRLGRNAIGMEMDLGFYEKAKNKAEE
jgi:site-specific DNA-methyltransferase (adenine-specific)